MPESGNVRIEGISLLLSVEAISANSFVIVDFFETDPYDKYAPFDVCEVFNDSSSKIKFLINQRPDSYRMIAGKSSRTIKPVKLWTARIEEQSGSNITSGEIRLTLEKLGATSDTLVKKLARKVGWLF